MKNSTRTYWSAVLDDFRRSGLGVRDFCTRRGVSLQAFYLRRRQFASVAPAFIEARIVPDAPAPHIVIELPSRERVLVPQQASESAVASVLRAIAQAKVGGAA
jgi:hypothetical protein